MSGKYVLFVIGERGSGKSTLIRSLTGCGRNKVRHVRGTHGNPLRAFVSLNAPQEMNMSTHSPPNFPGSIESKYHVKRSDYDILITALRLTVANQAAFGYQQYIQSVQKQGFDVRLAIIKTGWDGRLADSNETTIAQTFANSGHFLQFLADASKDPNEEASRIRQQLYP